jgi:uncharacterized protein YcbX
MDATVSWISIAPVKGMRMQELAEVELTRHGVIDDRVFFLVGDDGAMVSATRLGPLLEIVPEYRSDDADRHLTLNFPDGSVVQGPIEPETPIDVTFYGLELNVRPVAGPFSDAVSQHCGVDLRLVESPENRPGVDRGAIAGATLLGVGSLSRLEEAAAGAGQPGRIDPRRFRMNFGIDGIEPHEEDGWIDRLVEIGDAQIQIHERVGRCAATTRDPDAGNVDLKTLHHIRSYRGESDSPEPLPFGVFASIRRPGTVRLSDPVVPAPPA